MPASKQSFEHFYLTKVALGDCCGCAERVIDWRDIEQAASARDTSRGRASLWTRVKRAIATRRTGNSRQPARHLLK